MLSIKFLPYWAALNTDAKLSSKIMISEASLATSQPDYPMQNPTLAYLRAVVSLIPSPVTATIAPNSCRPVISVNLSSGVALARTFNLLTIYLKANLF